METKAHGFVQWQGGYMHGHKRLRSQDFIWGGGGGGGGGNLCYPMLESLLHWLGVYGMTVVCTGWKAKARIASICCTWLRSRPSFQSCHWTRATAKAEVQLPANSLPVQRFDCCTYV